ncbi:hypothetical protein [Niabella aurantiaca]|uniref:hypothetical protein n=1 Tax=Niabella aurantiaca TaxID=379900 RepID=UPI0003686EB7|nr:hypothetical protein [Niabella aurantiaca]
MKKVNLLTLLFMLLSFACKKNDDANAFLKPKPQDTEKKDLLQISFAKILAAAVYENKELRAFIKEEALTMFDNDYDILYHDVKNKYIGDGTFAEILAKYAGSPARLDSIVNELPLLTIFIPTLPSNFSPNSWNAETEIPKVAVRLHSNYETPYYDKAGREFKISKELIPGFPLLVVKENERVRISAGQITPRALQSTSNEVMKYEFIDEVFDGSKNKLRGTSSHLKSTAIIIGEYFGKSSLVKARALTGDASSTVPSVLSTPDATAITAFKNNYDWQRDYIYYGLTPTIPKGKLKQNYSEYLSYFHFPYETAAEAFSKISDQSPDPAYNPIITTSQYNSGSYWTDGYFEFQVDVLINGINGAGQTLTKYFTARADQLFYLEYEPYTPIYYRIKKVGALLFNPNLELIPWDLQSYGMAWKFRISEKDPSEERTYSQESTSTFATNFEVDVSGGEKVKVGMKFGLSSTTTHKSTFTQRYMLNSDDLGEAILTFDQPIIVMQQGTDNFPVYHLRAITSGWYAIAVEPRRVY